MKSALRFLLPCLLAFSISQVDAQHILLIERAGSPRTQKIYAGQSITYRLHDDKDWYRNTIESFRPDQQLIVLEDRFLRVNQVAALRFGKSWPRPIGIMLTTFGISWSTFALIGTATDGNPTTSYRWSDAAVTGVSAGLGLLLPSLFGNRVLRFGGERRRLRIVDVNFK